MDSDALTIFCGNISPKVTEELLYELFLQAGPLKCVKIPKTAQGESRTFGFIEYIHECSVNYAIQLFHGTALFGHELQLKHRKKNNTGPGSPIAQTNLPHHVQRGIHPGMQHFCPPAIPIQPYRPPLFMPGLIAVPSHMVNPGLGMFMPPVLPRHIHFNDAGLPRSNALPIPPGDDRKYQGSCSSSHQEIGCRSRSSYENYKTNRNDYEQDGKNHRYSNSAKHESYREDRKPYHKSEQRHSKSNHEDDFRESRRHRDRESDRRYNRGDHLEFSRGSRRSQGSSLPYHEDVYQDRRSHRGKDRTSDRRHHNDN